MEEIQNETQISEEQIEEPANDDNSSDVTAETTEIQSEYEGESLTQSPQEELILGKFKSVDDLSKAYQELERRQGVSSDELGALRRSVSELNEVNKNFQLFLNFICLKIKDL